MILSDLLKTLEDISGDKVKMFRAPSFSITEKNKWAFEVLHELGIEFDSSVFPSLKVAHGGMKSFGSAIPSLLEYNGAILKEFPINTNSIFGKPLCILWRWLLQVISLFFNQKIF